MVVSLPRSAPTTVSVVVPVRDGAATIGRQLAALERQTFEGEWDVVVSDDGSADATLEVIRRFEDRLPGFQIVSSPISGGPGAARNRGVAVTSGDFLMFCDADDEVEPYWITAMVAAAPSADLFGGRVDWDRLNEPEVRSWRERVQVDSLPDRLRWKTYASTCNFACWRDVFDKLEGFDESLRSGQDVDFSWRAQLAGFTLVFVPDAVIGYSFRPTIKSVIRQSFHYGRYDPALYAKFRSEGVPPPSVGDIAKRWAWVVKHVGDVRRRSTRGHWVAQTAYYVGRIVGAFDHRALYP